MSPEQIRLECLKLAISYETSIASNKIVECAREFEIYIAPPKPAAPEPDKADQSEQMYVLTPTWSSEDYVVDVYFDGLAKYAPRKPFAANDAKRFTADEVVALNALRKKSGYPALRPVAV